VCAVSAVEAIFAAVETWSDGASASDDRTVMVVAHPAADLGKTAAFPRLLGLI
jgi:hypothetical protein